MIVWPSLSSIMDSKLYSMEQEDTSITTKMEGGYVMSRARHTRAPRKMFTIGYTDISDADKQLLEAFWNTTRGKAEMFEWTNEMDSVTYIVRFSGKPVFKYSGLGGNHRWDVSGIKFEEV